MNKFLNVYFPSLCFLVFISSGVWLFTVLGIELRKDSEAYRTKLNNSTCQQTKLSLGNQAVIPEGKILFICEEK